MDDLEQLAHQILDGQPFSRLLGATLTEVGPQRAEISLTITDDLQQQHGYVHGGVLSYLADNSITFAGGLALGGDALTSEYKINYLRPATGSTLVARAHAHSVGSRQAVCRSDVYAVQGDRERLCATALGTVIVLPPATREQPTPAAP